MELLDPLLYIFTLFRFGKIGKITVKILTFGKISLDKESIFSKFVGGTVLFIFAVLSSTLIIKLINQSD